MEPTQVDLREVFLCGQGHIWKECRNYKHELLNPKQHVQYNITSMAAEAEKLYDKK